MTEFGISSHVDLDRVVDDLMNAYRTCRETSAYCIDEGGDLATLERLKAFDDCAEVNLSLANFLLRGSEHAVQLARVCLSVTQACADAIRDIEHGDPQLRSAYAVCQGARRACLQVLGEDVPTFDDDRDEVGRESFPASDPPPPPTEI